MLITNNYIRETSGALHRNSRPFLERGPAPNVTLANHSEVTTSEL